MFLHRFILSLNQKLPATNRWLVVASSVPVALASGTLFVYSAYSTQLAERCGLDATSTGQLNILATVGSAIGAVLSGVVTDMYGSQLPILGGLVFLSCGYFWLYECYKMGHEASLVSLLLAMLLMGLGSVCGYFASLKAVVVNFPNYKGSAQSVTIASFAISALIFLLILRHLGNTQTFLGLLSLLSAVLTAFGFVFIRIDGHIDNQELDQGLVHDFQEEIDYLVEDEATVVNTPAELINEGGLESDHLLGQSAGLEDSRPVKISAGGSSVGTLQHLSLKKSLLHPIFRFHYCIFAITQGFGQLYIFTVGFIIKAIHVYYTNKAESGSLETLIDLRTMQTIHVSIIAVASFLGRLTSGPVSDFVSRNHFQRHWMLILGSVLMGTGHMLNLVNLGSTFDSIHSANIFLLVVSLTIGFAYGFTFTCYPVIISDLFSMKNYSFIWGCIYTGTTFGLTPMNMIFGHVYDKNSHKKDNQWVCEKGSRCYLETFVYTSAINVVLIGAILVFIYIRRVKT